MCVWAILIVLGLGCIVNPIAVALNNGLGRTPAMGYNTWNAFHEKSAWIRCNSVEQHRIFHPVDEELMVQQAQRMVDLGLRDAGYMYFNVDGT